MSSNESIRRVIGKHTKFKLNINGEFLVGAAVFCALAQALVVHSWSTSLGVDRFFSRSISDFSKIPLEEFKSGGETPPLNDIRSVLQSFRERYRKSASEHHHHHLDDQVGRSKRDVILAEKMSVQRSRRKILNENEGTFVINEVKRVQPQYYDNVTAVDINTYKKGQAFIVSLEDLGGQRRLMINQLNEENLKIRPVFQTNAPNSVSVDLLNIKDDLFAFTTVKHDPKGLSTTETINTGSTLYRINFANRTLDKTQTIHLPYAQSSAFWIGMGEEANDMFLAIAPSKKLTETGFTYKVTIPCYRWQGGYFDYVSQLEGSNPQAINHFAMLSHDYLSVANYQDDTGTTSIQSEIFKYQHSESRFVSFQRIQTYGAKDIKHFTFESSDGRRKEHFIAIANNCKKDEVGRPQYWVQSTIMKFGEMRFMPFKTLYAYGALSFLPVKNGNKFFLALADLNGIRMFQYNGWTFVETYSMKYESEKMSPFSINLRQLNTKEQTYILVASTAPGVKNGMYLVNFETRNDHRKLITSVQAWCDKATSQIQSKNITLIENELNSSPKITDDRVIINGAVVFEKGVKIDELKSKALTMGRGRNLGAPQFRAMADNLERFRNLHDQINSIHSKMGNVIRTDQNQIVEGNIIFTNVQYKNGGISIKNLRVGTLSSIRVTERLANTVFLNQPQSLRGIVTGTVESDDIEVSILNERPLLIYAKKAPQTPQVFSGRNLFSSPVILEGNVKVMKEFASLDFSQLQFILYKGNQTFPGVEMKMKSSTVANLYTRSLNGKDVIAYFTDGVQLSGGNVKAKKTFKNLVIRNAQIGRVNKVDVDSMFKNAIYIDGRSPQVFKGQVLFEFAEFNEITPANPNINDKFVLSRDFINTEVGMYHLENVRIVEATDVQNLIVEKNLNNIKVFEGKLDILFANSIQPQLVKSKRLDSVHFTKDVEANDLIDGIQLKTWSPMQNIILDKNTIEGVLSVSGNINFQQPLIVGKSFRLGDSDALNTLRKIASTEDAILPGMCNIKFENLDVKGNSDVRGKINEIHPTEWVVNSEREVTITGEKVFNGGVAIHENTETKALYGTMEDKENIFDVLPTILLDGIDQTISQPIAFTKLVHAEKAFCPNTILNEIPFENLLFKKGEQTVHIKSIFRNDLIALNGASVKELNADVINGVHLEQELKDTLRTGVVGEVQEISGKYQFNELITKSAEVSGGIAEFDVSKLFSNIILKNSEEIVNLDGNELTFKGRTGLDHLDFVGLVNGMKSSEWGNAWMLMHGDQVVNTRVEFAVLKADIFQAPSVNQINVNELANQVIRIDAHVDFEGRMEFNDLVNNLGGTSLKEGVKVNEIDLRRDVLLKSSKDTQEVTGNKRFLDGAKVAGHLNVNEMPSFDINSFKKLHSPDQNSVLELQSVMVTGNIVAKQEPNFITSFNGHNWNDLMENTWLTDKDVVLKAPVQFSTLILENGGVLDKEGMLNGKSLKEFEENYASKTRDNEWTGEVVIGDVEMKSLKTNQVKTADGLLNGVDLKNFYDSVLSYSGDQDIKGMWKGERIGTDMFDAEAGAVINLHRVSDLMTLSGPNRLRAEKILDEILIDDIILTPDTILDGVNMGHWNDKGVRRDGSHVIKGPVEMAAIQTNEDVRVDGLVDGVKFDSKNILTTDLNQEITGNVVIHQPNVGAPALSAPGGIIVEGKLNGIDVKDAISKLVFKDVNDDSPIVIWTETEFDAPVVMNQVRAEGLVQGHNVRDMIERFTQAHDDLEEKGFQAKEHYENLLKIANRMLRISENRAVFLDYFVLTQTIRVPSTYVKILKKVGYPVIAIGFKKSAQVTTESWWSYSAPVDYYQLQIGNRVQLEGTVSDIAELLNENEHFFAFAVNKENNRPVKASLEVMNPSSNYEIDYSPEKFSKAFVLKSVDVGTASVRPAISQVIYSSGFNSLMSFSVGLIDCILATTKSVEGSVKIYCMDSGRLTPIQEISLDTPTMTTSVTISNETLLGILTRSGDGHTEGLLEMWASSPSPIKFVKKNCLPLFNAIKLDSISTKDGAFLVVASGELRKSEYKGSIFIYRYSASSQEFKKTQTIEIHHPKDVKLQWLKRSNEIILYVLSQSVTNNIQVFKYQGLSGWNLIHQFTSENGDSIEVTDFTLDNVYRAQLLVTSLTETNIYSAEFMGVNHRVEEIIESMKTETVHKRIDTDNL